jgi:DNA mismatch repair protein MutL
MSGAARRPIRRLPPELVARIAAGEVVERPASVVKELVENAVDAGARQISVRIEGGGLDRIVVADDGVGIPAEELPLAFERHATSKIASDAELARVGTLGFRGEALAAIAAVARVGLVSRTRDSDAAAALTVDGGVPGAPTVAARSAGTTVTVDALFLHLPARRKFLRSPAAEQAEITGTIDRLYLARPEVGVSLVANGAEIGRYPAARSLREAAGEVFGSEFAAAAIPLPDDGGPIGVEGWLGRPPMSRSSLAGLLLSVNGRTVRSRPLAQAVRLGFADHLPRARFPVGVIHLRIDPDRVDVNVHPSKREVRFRDESAIADQLRRAVRTALDRSGPRGEPPRGRERSGPAPGEGVASPPAPVPPFGRAELAPATRQVRLAETAVARPRGGPSRAIPLELLGPVGALYWVAASGEDAVLIDQHAASERLLYDELLARGRLARQELVSPLRLALTARQAMTLRAEAESVAASGFLLEPFGEGAWRIRAVPSYRGHRAAPEELPRLLDELADGGRPSVPDGLRERVAASIACHAAVRGGDRIAPEAMQQILDALLGRTEGSYACPHGRPILVRLPRGRLDRWFGRSGG